MEAIELGQSLSSRRYRTRRAEKDTYDSHVVEADGGTVHSDAKEGHEETHVEARARETLEDRSRVGLKSALSLRDGVPVGKKS